MASLFSVLNLGGTVSSSLANTIQLGGIRRVVVVLLCPTGELGGRPRVGLRHHGGLRDQPSTMVRHVGTPAPGLHWVRA